MRKLSVLSCFLLLTMGLIIPGCKKKEDISGKEQKPEVKISAEETARVSDDKDDKSSSEKAEQISKEKTNKASEETTADRRTDGLLDDKAQITHVIEQYFNAYMQADVDSLLSALHPEGPMYPED